MHQLILLDYMGQEVMVHHGNEEITIDEIGEINDLIILSRRYFHN